MTNLVRVCSATEKASAPTPSSLAPPSPPISTASRARAWFLFLFCECVCPFPPGGFELRGDRDSHGPSLHLPRPLCDFFSSFPRVSPTASLLNLPALQALHNRPPESQVSLIPFTLPPYAPAPCFLLPPRVMRFLLPRIDYPRECSNRLPVPRVILFHFLLYPPPRFICVPHPAPLGLGISFPSC